MNTSDLTIWPTSHPTATAASAAVRAESGSTWTIDVEAAFVQPLLEPRRGRVQSGAAELAGVEVRRHRHLLRARRTLVVPRRERLAVAPLMLGRATEREQDHATRSVVDELPAQPPAPPGSARSRPSSVGSDSITSVSRALEHQVHLLLALVAVDPAALPGLKHDLVHPERASPRVAGAAAGTDRRSRGPGAVAAVPSSMPGDVRTRIAGRVGRRQACAPSRFASTRARCASITATAR